MVTEEQVLAELSQIIDPDFQRDIVSLGFVQDMVIEADTVSFTIELTTPACPLSPVFQKQAIDLVGDLPDVEHVRVTMTARKNEDRRMNTEESGLKEVKYILAVSSCKGGVGKSTVSAMLARTLAARGSKVGLLDADVYGPSIPTLFNVHKPGVRSTDDNRFYPNEVDGLKLMSFGFLMGDGPAVIRGPMVAQYMQQLLHGVLWGELDYLIIDMPPGTGDVQLTISQSVQIDASVIVTTPHQLSLTDVRKGIMMFDKVNVPVLGVIENMSYFKPDCCDKKYSIFGEAGATTLEERFGLPTLAELPIPSHLCGGSDAVAQQPSAPDTADVVIRPCGKKVMEQPSRPEVEFNEKTVSLTWEDGESVTVSNSALRRACNCALCVDEMTRAPLLDPASIPMNIRAEKISMIGNYAILVDWSDGHNTGFFPFSAIRDVAGIKRKQDGFQGCEI